MGDHVRVQNQIVNHPPRWDKTGVVIEICQYHQHVIRVDDSDRVTIRNHKFLWKYTSVHQLDRRCVLDDLKCLPISNSSDHSSTPTTLSNVPIQSNVPLSSDSPKAFAPPHLLINICQRFQLYHHVLPNHHPSHPSLLPLSHHLHQHHHHRYLVQRLHHSHLLLNWNPLQSIYDIRLEPENPQNGRLQVIISFIP